MLGSNLGFKRFPVTGIKSAEAVYLFDPKHVTGLPVTKEAEQFGSLGRCPTLILCVGRGDPQTTLVNELLKVCPSSARVLLLSGGSKVRPAEAPQRKKKPAAGLTQGQAQWGG